MGKLKDKVAVVTGASKGIGAAIAEKLASEGAKVVVNYARDKAGAEKVVNNIQAAGGEAIAVQADVSRLDDIRKLFAETGRTFGRLDVLVNNAGVYEFRSLEQVDEEHYHRIFDLPFAGERSELTLKLRVRVPQLIKIAGNGVLHVCTAE